eukprot:1088896-Pyramimonas_sp.AAC.1
MATSGGLKTSQCKGPRTTGDNLPLPSAQAATMRELEEEDPRLTIAPFPRDGLSPISNFYPPKERRRRRAKAFAH